MPSLRLRPRLKTKITRRYIEKIERFSLSYFELYQRYSSSNQGMEYDDQKIVKQQHSLDTILLNQIDAAALVEEEKNVLRRLVDFLNDDGLFEDWKQIKKTIAKEFSIAPRKVNEILLEFQGLEPEGVGARSLVEFLQIQVRYYDLEDKEFEELLLEILKQETEILDGDFEAIAERLNVETVDIIDAMDFIKRNLNHVLPGKQYSSKTTQYVYSSAEVFVEAGEFKIVMLEDYSFVKDLEVMKDLNERKDTLRRILAEFFKYQDPQFFESFKFLRPVTQKEIAEALGLSSSFISRLVNKKFILLDDKTILLRKLFQRRVKYSEVTKFFFKEYFKQEVNLAKTDIEVQKEIVKYGIDIARRTVNYYRNMP